MKLYAFAVAVAGILFSIGTAFAYHPMDRNLRGTLDPEQLEWIELEHVQRGWSSHRPSATSVQPSASFAQGGSVWRGSARRGTDPVSFPTEHHTR